MRAALYLRVSTLNGQSTDNQRLELERVAERHGWQIVEVFEDAGISGARGREHRPAFDRMLKGHGAGGAAGEGISANTLSRPASFLMIAGC
jgi:DNA invertase Pin-like site-specific DNA recombinase